MVFQGLTQALVQVAGVKVNLFQHSDAHSTPDAVFPNNWFSTHPEGEAAGGTQESTLVFYPMKCPNRSAPDLPRAQVFDNCSKVSKGFKRFCSSKFCASHLLKAIPRIGDPS